MPTRLLIPLPDRDFDVTEVCRPWQEARRRGVEVTFATPAGQVAQCDPLLITGVIFGLLGASQEAIAIYRRLEADPAFLNPISYQQIEAHRYDGLLLAGGHAKGMKVYLESPEVQSCALHFMSQRKPVGAICHGPIVLARTVGVLRGRRCTALPWILEFLAYVVTAWKLGDYYRTYPVYVQDEVVGALGNRSNFVVGNPLMAQVVVDDHLVTARWPGDAELFGQTFVDLLFSRPRGEP